MSYPLPNASTDLTGKVAVVTGASSGLGLRFAKVLASHGAKVAVAARRADRLEALVNEIKNGGGEAIAVTMDVKDADQLKAGLDKVERELGLATILVNNAGMPDAARAHKMSVQLIDDVLDVNVRGPFILACDFARRLIDAKQPGRIINIASMAAFSYRGGGAALYAVSKAAVVRMTEALAVEWASFNINVNAIAPGVFKSEMMDEMIERVGETWKAFPRQRLCDPALLDSTLLYLAGPASEAVTGTCIKVDDGQGAR